MWVLVLVSCGEAKSGSADGGPVVCPESGLEPQAKCPPGTCVNGPACEPIFDDCGELEVPLLGGGCRSTESIVTEHRVGQVQNAL